MEYIIEQFNLDMRKLDLYVENAENEYLFACEEASLYGDDEGILITEAEKNLGTKIGNFFTNLIQKIHDTITKIIEKVREFFTKKKAEEVTKTIQSNPELAKEKVKIPDVKKIEDACGKRKLLVKSLIKKAKAGKLTEDELDSAIEKYDKYTKIAKGAGVVVVTAGAAVGLVAFTKYVNTRKKQRDDAKKNIQELNDLQERLRKKRQAIDDRASQVTFADYDKHYSYDFKKVRQDAINKLSRESNSADDRYKYSMMHLGSDPGDDLSAHRKLARLIALEATDSAQVEAYISEASLEELVRLSNASEYRSIRHDEREIKAGEITNTRQKYHKATDIMSKDIINNGLVGPRIDAEIKKRMDSKDKS